MPVRPEGREKTEWVTIKIPRQMADRIDWFLEQEAAKELAFTSRTDVVVEGVRRILAEQQTVHFGFGRLVHGNVTREPRPDGKEIIAMNIYDNEAGNWVKVVIDEDRLLCASCNLNYCVHTVYAWSNPEFSKILQEKGILRNVVDLGISPRESHYEPNTGARKSQGTKELKKP